MEPDNYRDCRDTSLLDNWTNEVVLVMLLVVWSVRAMTSVG